ncbi:MAG: CheR family methyltransferase [Chryseolinea sp.]
MDAKKKEITVRPPKSKQDFPIVGVGASAGGLEAFKLLIRAIPEDSGMAYVLVQHLDPTHGSLLPEILSRETSIPVNEITDDIHLAPNHIYVIPENKTLTSTDGILKLTPREKIKKNLAIDVFFISLAEVHKQLAVGVVLSGTASDGTLGLKAIKKHGGVTFAQDQKSAVYGEMPQNAVNANVVDFILPPDEIPEKLIDVFQTVTSSNTKEQDTDDVIAVGQILSLLRQRSRVDFTSYKQTTIRRRIARRMALHKYKTLVDYGSFLETSKAEQDALFHDVLIPITSFFRDTKIFETIQEKVFPALLRNKPEEDPIRIWIAGCSTGEEAYSIAISLLDFLGKASGRRIQILASDISEVVITKARTGIYLKREVENLPELLVKKYFIKSNGDYQVSRQVRDLCVFATHNFLKDPPFAKMDLISCRNVLIYMDTSLQKKALTTFHYALREGGCLLLGKSETTSPASELFSPFSKTDKIYLRKAMPNEMLYVVANRETSLIKKPAKTDVPSTDFKKSAESILLAKYTPASIIVNEHLDIVHFHGDTSFFLQQSPGKPTFNLLRMAREDLLFELRNLLLKVKTTNAPSHKEGIRVTSHEQTFLVNIDIIPLTNMEEIHQLILFHKMPLPEKSTTPENGNGVSSLDETTKSEFLQRIDRLEKELAQTHEDMRSISEDQEAANEELQSANEELLSSSEELQSLNEELETSKEELQSSNEELIITNQELLDKQDQVNLSRLYTEAIVNTVREPLTVLERDLRIKTINASFHKKFAITSLEAEGNFIYEIKNGLFENPILRSLLEKVIPQRIEVVDFEMQVTLAAVGECTVMLNARHVVTEKSTDQFILLGIEDITQRKIAQQRMIQFSEGLEEKIKDRTASLEQTNQQLEQFAHIASHELQEPLRKITTFSRLLQQSFEDGKPEEVIKKYLSKVEESSTRLTSLVQHMLDFASVTHHEKYFEKTKLSEIYANVLNDFELLIGEKKAIVTCDPLPEIEAIYFQLHQLFYDLISNALKFSKTGEPPIIHIAAHKLTKEQIKLRPALNGNLSYYDIVFTDEGIGFEQKYAQQIFTIFQRLHATGGMYAGTGIGLALCKKIVQKHHGEIYAEGKPKAGASFHVILPVQQVQLS